MVEWMKKHKLISIGILVLLFVFFIILMPLILNTMYYSDAPCNFFTVGYDISSILNYYGAILTFIGTVSLGAITVYQNYISQKKTDEINRLTLELQKKSMAMAEQNYEKEKQEEINRNTPRFELKSTGCNGHYMNLTAVFKNISSGMVSAIKSLSFEVFDEVDTDVINSDKVVVGKSSLLHGEETNINFYNNELTTKKVVNEHGLRALISLKKFSIVWSFQCEDLHGKIHYFKAKLYVEDSNNFIPDLWKVEKVG